MSKGILRTIAIALVVTGAFFAGRATGEETTASPIDPKVFRSPKFSFVVEQKPNGSAVLVSRNLQNQKIQRIPLAVVKAGTSYYHWTTNLERLRDWTTRGAVSPQEMENRVAGGDGLAGGGVYTSLSGTDSINYGHKVIAFTAPKDLLVLPPLKWEDIREAWKKQLPDEAEPGTDLGWTAVAAREVNRALLKAGVSGAHAGTTNSKTWHGWFDPLAVSQAREATFEDIFASPWPSRELLDFFTFDKYFPNRPNPMLKFHPLVQKVVENRPLSTREKAELSKLTVNFAPDAGFRDTILFKKVRAAATTEEPSTIDSSESHNTLSGQ